jgi:hypothetical protein
MQDFANYKSNYRLEGYDFDAPRQWSPDFPSVLVGIFLGVFLCLVGLRVTGVQFLQASQIEPVEVDEDIENKSIEFEFYEELKIYEVSPIYSQRSP